MGTDSTIKSGRAEQRQRLIIVFSVLTLVTACFMVVQLLGSGRIKANVPTAEDQRKLDRFAAAKALAELKKFEVKSDSSSAHAVGKIRAAASNGGGSTNDGAGSVVSREEQEKVVAQKVAELDAEVREIKKTGVIMEADEHSLEVTGKLQEATRELMKLRYGDPGSKNYRIRFELEFQPTIPDFVEKGKDGEVLLELAPISLIPCSVFNFLEIARTWEKGAFHRNAPHVLQAQGTSAIKKPMPFQEYHKDFPHKKGTIGYAGRPSGPEFYISIEDNTFNHGPGSQQNHNPYEADCIIGKVISGMDDVVPRIHKMPGTEFLGNSEKWVLIRRMVILVPGDGPDGYKEYSKSPLVIPE